MLQQPGRQNMVCDICDLRAHRQPVLRRTLPCVAVEMVAVEHYELLHGSFR